MSNTDFPLSNNKSTDLTRSILLLLSYLFVFMCLQVNTASATSTQKIAILGYDIPKLLEKNRTGEYDKILMAAFKKVSVDLTYKIVPPARADLSFDKHKVDCIIPYDKSFHKNPDTVNSLPLNIAKAYIYTDFNTLPIHNISDLSQKTVGARNGMLYGKDFDQINASVQYVERIEQNIDKLLSGRIDAFVAWSPDSDKAFKLKGISPLTRGKAFMEHKDSMLCHDNEQNRAFIKELNKALKEILTT